MTDGQIFALIDAAFADCSRPSIGLSGGEAFVFFDRLCRIVRYATEKGALISINTNAFWGTTLAAALEKVEILRDLNVSQLVVSVDDFHLPYVKKERVINVIRACKSRHLPVHLQYVATRSSRRLADFLAEHGDDLLNIECREIPCHPVGRAATMVAPEDLFTTTDVPTGLCPSAILSISADGRMIPCCNTAGHLPTLELGVVGQDDLVEVNESFKSDPVFVALRALGPSKLLPAATAAGFQHREGGYVDQCHLCYELFRDPDVAARIRDDAPRLVTQWRIDRVYRAYHRELSRVAAASANDDHSAGTR